MVKKVLFLLGIIYINTSGASDPVHVCFSFKHPWSATMLETEASTPYRPGSSHLTYDTLGFFINGKPVFLHSGEIQYFRIPEDQWEDVIIKAKNGGLNCIATCVYWGIHEPKDNLWNFEGRYNIARFLSICQKYGMYVILRIGPIINAETRNAGLPQWVRQQLPGKYNHQLYPTPQWFFEAVDDYFRHLSGQVSRFFPLKGGNVILVQLDNETNCSWIWGRPETRKYAQITINTYLELAKNAGFEGPFTSTYWEPTHAVRAKGSIPGTGAYPLGNWHLKKTLPAFDGFNLSETNHFQGFNDTLDYPVLAIENQGGGGYYTITPPDLPTSYNLADIASGVNATSYYIYGAGTNPQRYPGPWFGDYVGKSVARPNVTQMSYDLHSPLGEFQQIRDSYHPIRRSGMFLESFGGTLQKLPYLNADTSLRIFNRKYQACMRESQGCGFIFVNAYALPCENLKNHIVFSLKSGNQTIVFPKQSMLHVYQNKPLTIPFRLMVGGISFRYSTANPLTLIKNTRADHLVFYANGDDQAEFYIEGIKPGEISTSHASVFKQSDGVIIVVDPSMDQNMVVIKRKSNNPLVLKVLSEKEALKAYRVTGIEDKLFFTDLIPLDVLGNNLRFEYTSTQKREQKVRIYPSSSFSLNKPEGQFTETRVQLQLPMPDLKYRKHERGYRFSVSNNRIPGRVKEVYLNISEPGFGKGAELYADGMLVADTYYHLSGDSAFAPWSFGLKRFLKSPFRHWVVEKQPGSNEYKLFSQLTGQIIGIKDKVIQMLPDGNDASVLWVIVQTGMDEGTIQSKANGKWMSVSGNRLILGDKPVVWKICHSDDFYKTISLGQDYITCREKEVTLSAKEQEVVFDLKSFAFVVSLKDFTFKREDGIFTAPSHATYLLESNVILETGKENQSD